MYKSKPSPWVDFAAHHIGAGFFTEWWSMVNYTGANFQRGYYWTSDEHPYSDLYTVNSFDGSIYASRRDTSNNSDNNNNNKPYGLCVYP